MTMLEEIGYAVKPSWLSPPIEYNAIPVDPTSTNMTLAIDFEQSAVNNKVKKKQKKRNACLSF